MNGLQILCSKSSLIREDGIFWRKTQKSSWVRVKYVDEIWIYLKGDSLDLCCFDNVNKSIRNLILDSNNPAEIIPNGY